MSYDQARISMNHILLVLFGGMLVTLGRVSRSIAISIAILLIGYAIYYAKSSWDYDGYIKYFECVRLRNCYNEEFDIEFSFVTISKIFGIVFDSSGGPLLVIFYTSLSVALKLNILRDECKAFGVALFGYLCLGWFLHEMTQIRVGLAIAFLWFAVRNQSRNANWRALVYLGLAIITHYSAALAILYLAFRNTVVNTRKWVGWFIVTLLAGRILSNYAVQFAEIAGSLIDSRLTIYASAFGSEFLTLSQLNVHSVIAVTLVTLCVSQGIHEWTKFEVAALKFAILGITFYMLFFWIPVIGLRVFELLSSFLPIVGAAGYRANRSKLVKTLILAMFFSLFVNTVLRNGLMLDFVLPGQAQETLLNGR